MARKRVIVTAVLNLSEKAADAMTEKVAREIWEELVDLESFVTDDDETVERVIVSWQEVSDESLP